MDKPRSSPIIKIFLCGLIGGVVLLGIAAYAMTVSDSRPFCTTCHLMTEAGVTHKMSTHADLSCNDSHAPHNLLAKLPFKAKEAVRDFVYNVQGADLPLGPNSVTREVVNANCIACHSQTNVNVASMNVKPYCVDCHRNVAHMRHKPISTRTVAYD